MSLFDVFTGKSVKRAQEQNRQDLAGLKTEGMGYLDSGLSKSTGALENAAVPFENLAAKYGKGGSLYLDATGANGTEGLANARNLFTQTPGYTEGLNMSLDALDRRAASRGMLSSGNTIADTTQLATNYADQKYGDFVSRLAPTIAPEVQATSGMSGVNTALAGLYSDDAKSRVNLASGVTQGNINANNTAAQAEMQGSGNLWNFGLNLAKLGSGFWGYGAGKST